MIEIQARGKHDIHNAALFIQQRQRIDAELLQHLLCAPALGQRQASGRQVRSLGHSRAQRTAAQNKFADITIGHGTLQNTVFG